MCIGIFLMFCNIGYSLVWLMDKDLHTVSMYRTCTMGTGSFPGVEAAGAWGWPPTPHLECRGPRKSTAIPLLTLRAFVAYKKGENLPSLNRISQHSIVASVLHAAGSRFESRLKKRISITGLSLTLKTRSHKARKSSVCFVMSVRLSACSSAAPTGRIFMKFDNGDL